MTGWKGFSLFVSICLVCILPSAARCAGLFEDPVGLSSFLLSPREPSLASSMYYAEDEYEKASLYILTANYPLKTRLFLQAQQPYITVSTGREIVSGFGDFRLRLRGDLFVRPGHRLYFLGGLRTGSGTRLVYPYSAGSIDAEIGLAVVDTLSSLAWWGALTGATVWRGPDEFDDQRAHKNFVAVQLGLVVPIHSRLDLGLTGSGYLLQTRASRELYAIGLVYRATPAVNLFGSVMAEGGKPEERVDDYSAAVGVRVFYR